MRWLRRGEGKGRGMGDDRGGVGEEGPNHYVRNGITACLDKNVCSDQDAASLKHLYIWVAKIDIIGVWLFYLIPTV